MRIPYFSLERDKQISDAMAEAGFKGNLFVDFASGKAASVGSKAALEQDRLLFELLSKLGG